MENTKTVYLILSGEFVMECSTLDEANIEFDNFKSGVFSQTYLFIYKAKKIREE